MEYKKSSFGLTVNSSKIFMKKNMFTIYTVADADVDVDTQNIFFRQISRLFIDAVDTDVGVGVGVGGSCMNTEVTKILSCVDVDVDISMHNRPQIKKNHINY